MLYWFLLRVWSHRIHWYTSFPTDQNKDQTTEFDYYFKKYMKSKKKN